MTQQYMTTDEVAELLRTSPETVRYWRHIGKGPASFKVGKAVLYDVSELKAYIQEAKESQRA